MTIAATNGIVSKHLILRLPMARKPEPKQDDPEQYKRFLEAAKEAGADETAKGADKAFKAVVKPTKAKS
jgi:hypothetical protein